MKSLRPVFRYLFKYPKLIAAYFTFNILSSLFAVISLGLLSPFLLLIFKKQDTFKAIAQSSPSFFNKYNPVTYFKDWLYNTIKGGTEGEIRALGIICTVVLFSSFLRISFSTSQAIS